MRNGLQERSRNDLRRVLGEMESLAPLPPEWESKPVDLKPVEPKQKQPVLVAILAAAAVFAVGLPVALLTNSNDAVTPSQTSTDLQPPSTGPTGWSIAEVPDRETVLETTDRGFLAVTSEVVRTSDDGFNWKETAHLDEGVFLYDITRLGDVVVAAGARRVDPVTGEMRPSAIWTSTDAGETWTSTDLGVTDITATPEGFAAVGVERDDSDPDHNRTTGVLWTSPDGLTWNETARSDDPEGVSSYFRNVVWDGRLVILGQRGPDFVSEGSGLDDSEPHESVTWFSDGSGLSSPTTSNLVGGGTAEATPHGLIAVTNWSTPEIKTVAAAWISQDGIHWEHLDIEPGTYEYTDIAHVGGNVFITGYLLDSPLVSGAWSSTDGVNWTRIELPTLPEFTKLEQVTATDSALVVAGDISTTGVIASRQLP